LRDWSGFGNHGTLTNMDAGTDWIPTDGRYALDFDGTDDYVDCGIRSYFSPNPMTLSLWLKMNATPSAFDSVCGNASSGGWNGGWGLYFSTTTTLVFWLTSYTVNFSTSVAFTPANLNHVCCWYNGATLQIYINGQPGTSDSFAGTPNSSAQLSIGRNFRNTENINGRIMDFRLNQAAFSPAEISLLALRPGIAYEMAPGRRSSVQVAAAFNRRRRLLIGAGS
jgi:hypothetical protein